MSDETIQPVETTAATTNPADNEKLMSALEKERQQRAAYEKELKTMKRQLEAFSGVDPELAKQAQQILQQKQEWEERESKLREEVDAQYKPKLSEYEQQTQALRQQLTQREQQLLDYKRDTLLERAFQSLNGFEGEFEDVAHRLRSRTKINPETGELEVLGADGKRMYSSEDPSKPATVEQLIKQLQKENIGFARHFKGYESGGAGINGVGRGGAGDPNWEKLPAWERVSKMREQQGRV